MKASTDLFPLVAMYAIGAWVLVPLGWPIMLLYASYVVASNVFFIGTVCPSCLNFGRASCGSGYGLASARLAGPGGRKDFAPAFKRATTFIALSWVLPVMGGLAVLLRSWNSPRGLAYASVTLTAYCIIAFGVLPATSKRECARCPMRERCPGARLTAEGRHGP